MTRYFFVELDISILGHYNWQFDDHTHGTTFVQYGSLSIHRLDQHFADDIEFLGTRQDLGSAVDAATPK